MGVFSLPAEAAQVTGTPLLVFGGAFLGYGLPLWSRVRKEQRQRTREWRHALEMVRLREQQAAEDPGLTVEVLERVDRQQPLFGPSKLVVGGHHGAEVFHLGEIQVLPSFAPLLERFDVNMSSGGDALIGGLVDLQWNHVGDQCALRGAHEQ
jgi:hypothetical protein